MKNKNVLFICAHPDDIVSSNGGTLAKLAEEGFSIHTLILTYGEILKPHLKKHIVQNRNRAEAKKAIEILGGKSLKFLNMKSGGLKEELKKQKNITQITDTLKKLKPIKIYTHKPEDTNIDHRSLGKKILEIVDENNVKTSVYGIERMAAINFKRADYPVIYEDITKQFKTKQKAMNSLKNLGIGTTISKTAIKPRALYNGQKINAKYAEAFFKMR